MDAEEAGAVEVLLLWLLDLRADWPGLADERARESGAVAAAMLLADRAGCTQLTGRTVQKHWRTLIAAQAHEDEPENCAACARLREVCPFHQGVDRGVAYAADWIAAHARERGQITRDNAADVAREMLATA